MQSSQVLDAKKTQKMTHYKIISPIEARNVIHRYLSMNHDERLKEINLLTLQEIKLYLSTVKIIKNELPELPKEIGNVQNDILSEWRELIAWPCSERTGSIQKNCNEYLVYFKGKYRANVYSDKTFTINPDIPSNIPLNNLLLELTAQKIQLEYSQSLKESLKVGTLDNEEKSEDKIVLQAEKTAAIDAMNMYEDLLNHNR